MTHEDLDTAALESYLSRELDENVVDIEVLDESLNLSLAVSTADEENAYVLRRPTRLRHTDVFNDLRAEYRLLERLEDAAVPTPTPISFCEDGSIVGDSFFVTTFLEGESIPMGSTLRERFPTAHARREVATGLVDALAEIHALEAGPFEDATQRHTPLEQVDRAVDRLDRAREVTGRELPTLRAVAEWLRENAPSDRQTALVHGDFKPGNVLLEGTDDPEVTGVLDWEAAMVGDPRTELGYLLLYWRDEGDPTPPVDEIAARYSSESAIGDLRDLADDGFYPFTTLPGSPDRAELVARYEDRTGIAFDDGRYFRAHAALMLATVWEDLHRYCLETGVESHYEPLVDYMAATATDIVDGGGGE
jgi:aminoglycoside phosphotransferase (APT) family kinase protein